MVLISIPMDEEVDVFCWIEEFLLQLSENNGVVNTALKAIPFPTDDLRLKKTVLLGAMEHELCDASVSETFLENLEMVEELDHRQGYETSHSMKDAYCAVALECTVKYLVVGAARRPGRKYLEAVKRIWKGRISQMEKSGKSHLLTDELKKRREEVGAAIFDASLSRKLSAMNTRNDALRLVEVYLGEAWALMGPAFLELAERLRDKQNGDVGSDVDGVGDVVDGGGAVEKLNARDGHEMDSQPTGGAEVQELVAVSSPNSCSVDENGSRNNQLCDKAAEEAVVSSNACRELLVIERHVAKDKEIQKENLAPGCKHVASHPRHKGPVKRNDIENLGPDTSYCKSDSLSTGKVNKGRQAVKASCLELQAIKTDPLPEAIRVSETVISDLATKEVKCEPSMQKKVQKEVDIRNPFADKSAEPIHQSCACVDLSAEPILSFTSVDEIADGSPEGEVNHTSRLHPRSPKREVVSPLQNEEITKLSKRRKVKRWSLLEEETLRTGIQEYGVGNWKQILNSYGDIFEDRKQVDLKDKWRNMTKYAQR